MSRCFRWLVLFVLVGTFLLPTRVGAQSSPTALLSLPDTEAFPLVRTYLDIHSVEGNFVHGIDSTAIRVFENGLAIQLAEFKEHRPGVQFVVAINPGDTMGIRNSLGTSRYELLSGTVTDWASLRQGSSIDDVSLLVTGGPERTHQANPQELITALAGYPFDPGQAAPTLDALLRAMNTAADPTTRPGMERAVLFITSPLEGDLTFGLQNLVSLATQQRIHVFIWMAASPQAFDTLAARQLAELALQTGGQFFAFSSDEAVPAIENYLEPLRDIYSLAYESNIRQGGPQELSVEIDTAGGTLQSAPISFELDLQPPDPAFILPSTEILRQVPADKESDLLEELGPDDLFPTRHDLQILVDFPDGRLRPLARTALYVDGALVDENLAAPFDRFSWDLRSYNVSGQHLLQVEALDNLGLKGASIQLPLTITVLLSQPDPLRALAHNWPIMAGLAGLVGAALLMLFLLLGGRISPRLMKLPLVLRPAPQSVPIHTPGQSEPWAVRRARSWATPFQWPQRRLNPHAYAFLTRTGESEDGDSSAPVSITSDEITFGSDPNQATLVLEDASVAALHARLVRRPDGSVLLSDQGSVAGTWVNYAPVSAAGVQLEHGDLIHVGRAGFRYNLRESHHGRKPVVTLQEMTS